MTEFSIITPCLNAEKYIEETIRSVLYQRAVISKNVDLEYIICDGASSDRTLEIIESFGSNLIKVVSEKDCGMYDALAKGLKSATGDIVAYINAGDYYSPHAFEIVLEIFRNHDVKWLTGLSATYNEKSHLIMATLPFKYRQNLIQTGFYGTMLPWIQQESIFWDSCLNAQIDYNRLKQFQYAGDHYLWQCFSSFHALYIVEAWLAGFKVHSGQLSSDIFAYQQEMKQMSSSPTLASYIIAIIDKLIWYGPNGLKRLLNHSTLFSFDHKTKHYVSNK